MVWFQCEDCGDNLKKPKLLGHFNMCSASKLSCIDCGEIFGQESVQSHTQCITETEKYGPKGQAKPLNGSGAKTNKDSKGQSDFDVTVGLSNRPPWFCSICNTKATSRQTLLLHAEGKKHKGRARAIHNSNQKQTEESGQETKSPSEIPPKSDSIDEKQADSNANGSEANNGNLESEKKRKLNDSDDKDSRKKAKEVTSVGLGNGEVNYGDKVSKSHSGDGDSKEKIKWKKLITSALKSSPDGVLKLKKLRKQVLKALQESGIAGDKDQLKSTFESKITSSSRFVVESKNVRLVAKN